MKRSLRMALILLSAAAIFSLPVIALTSESRFVKFCDDFFREEMEENALTLHYTVSEPENYGIETDDISMGTYRTDPLSQKKWIFQKKLALETFAKGQLSQSAQRIYDLLKYRLELETEGCRYTLLQEPLVPSIGIQSQLPILLAEYTFSSKDDVESYLSLLSCIPDYFDSILWLEEQKLAEGLFMDTESAEELITYCREFLTSAEDHFLTDTFSERLDTLSLSKKQQSVYLKEHSDLLNRCVFPSYQKLQDFLSAHKNDGQNPNGLFYYPDGTDYYAWLLRSEVGIDHSFDELETILNTALQADAKAIAALTKKDPTLLSQRESIRIDTSNPAGLTSYLAKRASYDFPAVLEISPEIREVPSSMEPHLSPAFYLVPPVDHWEENVIYLNNGYLKTGLSFFTTLAHEGYPGHLYQTVYENQTEPHPILRLLHIGGYSEGWATYAEQFSYRYAPISEDLAALLSATRTMTLNLYSHLDLYIHGYGWTEEDCSAYLKKFGITSGAAIHEMYLLAKQQPANYLKYYMGYLEICALRTQAQNALGENFCLKDFHEFILSNGSTPFPLLETYLNRWIQNIG